MRRTIALQSFKVSARVICLEGFMSGTIGLTNRRLSDDQRALAEKWFMYAVEVSNNRFGHTQQNSDDITDFAVNCLITAAQYYTEGRGCKSFKSFLVWVLRRTKLKHKKAQTDENLTCRLSDQDPQRFACHTEPMLDVLDLYNRLKIRWSIRDRTMIRLRGEGYTEEEVAEIFGCTQQTVSYTRHKAVASGRVALGLPVVNPKFRRL